MPAVVAPDVSVTTFTTWEDMADKKFDFIFIGISTYDNMCIALVGCKQLANEDTLIAVDGTVKQMANMTVMNDGPVRAWGDIKQDGIVRELSSEDYNVGQGMSVGRYV